MQMCHVAQESNKKNINFNTLNEGKTFSPIDYSRPDNRLYERSDGTLGTIEKSPAEVFGEVVLRPLINKTISVGKGFFHFIRIKRERFYFM